MMIFHSENVSALFFAQLLESETEKSSWICFSFNFLFRRDLSPCDNKLIIDGEPAFKSDPIVGCENEISSLSILSTFSNMQHLKCNNIFDSSPTSDFHSKQ